MFNTLWQKLRNSWKNFIFALILLTTLVFIWYANTYFQQTQDIRSKAETTPQTVITGTYALTSNHTYSGMTFTGAGSNDSASKYGAWGSGLTNVTLSGDTFMNTHYGLKIGTGPQSSNINADGLTFRHLAEPLFLANVSNSAFSNIDIQADKYDTNQWHGIYLERGNHNLTFRNVKITGGSGYSLQLYYSTPGTSDTLLFENLTLDATTGRYPLVIQSYDHVIFRNVTIIGGPAGGALIRFYGGSDDIVFDGFTARGGDKLVTWSNNQPTNVTFKNGTYYGTQLSDKMSAFTFENVTLGSSTPTSTTLPSSTPNPRATATPTPRPTAAPTQQPGNITLAFNLGLDGIGAAGDHPLPCTSLGTCNSNKNPKRTGRDLNITILDQSKVDKTPNLKIMVNYDSTTGTFKGNASVNLSPGNYMIKAKVNGLLTKTLASIQNLTAGTNQIPSANLTTGDIDDDNQLTILDYNILISCSIYSNDQGGLCNKKLDNKTHSDFNDNGAVDQIDYNLFLREYPVQNGD
ncbi:MAG: hypothetical protein A2W22_01525 [Candidatus Levybacteria bacterium RBG_16_35_11]|nr:MAG: hypothetical protein A2W22_01525 [Candidatus Levybacteria bacterium RBG_16_35_11]